ncbi:YjbH domain-containing protein [Streptomyces sp. ST2-7A]|uniref:YjbH domain-containing protein n=1 Tax=Streptomyces sp. ST2-7A TaxID=2907214 RepID=UPI001F47FE53|nr:YjbH domain-containing protein [Streptomyces sp. ST2-7A]MCE7080112.1 YjbH domain-containing protein [Streptomyces sp. ST2-7A]
MSAHPPTGSLADLAARNELPRHQYVDHATVRWIETNRPPFAESAPPRLRPASRRLLHRCAIPAHWLAERRCLDSLHGVRHAMRTAVLAALLAEDAGLGAEDTAVLVIAAATHDCRRLHDKRDRGHGARAARWLGDNAAMVFDHFHVAHDRARVAEAATAVRLHDLPYAAFTPADEHDRSTAEAITDLLKAADALDRYRLPKLSWWPDPGRLRVPLPPALHATAFELVVASEAAHLAGLTSSDAVFHALEQQGVFR